MIIASWNVNSVKARLPRILDWFDERRPDVCVLQELKCVDEAFPIDAFEQRGYRCHVYGQKAYNGVALLSRETVEDVSRGLPDFDDEQARFIEGVVHPANGAAVRVCGLYLPNGNPAPGPKYDYKLAFMEALEAHLRTRLAEELPLLLLGDFNVIPEPQGVYDPAGWIEDALFRPETRAAYRRLLRHGLYDALAHRHGGQPFYTYWDYQGGAWDKDLGLRIDHVLMSAQAIDRLTDGGVDRHVREPMRGSPDAKPSDHVPVWVGIDA